MLERYEEHPVMDEAAYDEAMDGLRLRLTVLQQQIREKGIGVVVVLEGWGASGKGTLIGNLISELDPRGYKVHSMVPATAEEQRYTRMRRYWLKIPRQGQMAFFDRSWYQDISVARVESRKTRGELAVRTEDILDLERQLGDEGYVIVKFFLHIDSKEQRKRFKRLEEKKATRWRVTRADWRHNEQYDEHYRAFDKMLTQTDRPWAPWTVLEAWDERYVTHRAYETLINALERALARQDAPADPAEDAIRVSEAIVPLPILRLDQVDLSQTMEEEEYRLRLKDCQRRLSLLHNKIYRKRIPMVLAFEGWDAAGKGGNIRRLARELDPRGYEVLPICAPTAEEKERPFLWRFWCGLPKDGHIAIFDRSWYGRVMVERIEGFCSQPEWQRAYDEINHFERQLGDWGAVTIKFWLQINQDEQLVRFNQRMTTPEKRYKITDEDWRNREKWDAYVTAVNEMLARTNTVWAPWVIVESNNKLFARIKVLETVISVMEARL